MTRLRSSCSARTRACRVATRGDAEPGLLTIAFTRVLTRHASARALQKRIIEWSRKDISQFYRFALSLQIDECDLNIATKLPQDLPARPARRRERIRIRCHRDPRKCLRPLRHRFEHRHALGAHRQPVGGILYIASSENVPALIFQRRPHLEMRKRRMRILSRLERRLSQLAHRYCKSAFRNSTSRSRT